MLGHRFAAIILRNNEVGLQVIKRYLTSSSYQRLSNHGKQLLRSSNSQSLLLNKDFKRSGLIWRQLYSTAVASQNIEAEEYRIQNKVTVTGSDVPQPIQDFQGDFFPDYIKEYLQKQNFEEPTIIQAQGWPIAMSGKNLVGIAQTGTGKTLAYLLPAVMKIKENPPSNKFRGPCVLILAPTRELVQQIYHVAQTFSETFNLRSVCVFGGAPRGKQLYELQRGADIVIATPGRLIDFLKAKTTNLLRCNYLVLDEADRMLDMGFEPQIREIVEQVPSKRQVLMWSATWPKEVQNLAKDYLGDYVQINVGSTELSANQNIEQKVYICEEEEKDQKLIEILQELAGDNLGKVLIFANMKRKVEDICWQLQRNGWPAVGIHGDKTQNQRDRVIHLFKSGRAKILVASDVAARGLDVQGIKHVINYDYPPTSEDYVHRIGRTGRSNQKGTSHTLLTSENAKQARDLIKVFIDAKQEVPETLQNLANEYSEAREMEIERKRMLNNNRFGGNNRRWSQYGGNSGSRYNKYKKRYFRDDLS